MKRIIIALDLPDDTDIFDVHEAIIDSALAHEMGAEDTVVYESVEAFVNDPEAYS